MISLILGQEREARMQCCSHMTHAMLLTNESCRASDVKPLLSFFWLLHHTEESEDR
jgi:hypothetical protein